jgi:hypothetical protein
MSIFVNPEETFPIVVKLKIKNEVDGVITSIKICKPEEEGDDIISLIVFKLQTRNQKGYSFSLKKKERRSFR